MEVRYDVLRKVRAMSQVNEGFVVVGEVGLEGKGYVYCVADVVRNEVTVNVTVGCMSWRVSMPSAKAQELSSLIYDAYMTADLEAEDE